MSPAPDGGTQPMQFRQHRPRTLRPIAEPVLHRWLFADGTVWLLFHRQGSNYLLRFPGLADFTVSADGLQVQGWPAPGVSPGTLEHLYLNQVMPLALSRQGKLVLHASAVETQGRCLAFVGKSGRGKSTLAASFATSGTRFLTDDGLQLQWRGGQLTVVPSHPSIRLWEDSQMALIGQTQALAPALDYTTKVRILAGPDISYCDQAKPLHAIYFLGEGGAAAPALAAVKPVDALMLLVGHSFLLDIGEREMLARHFDEIARIANLPIHYHLDYPRRYGELPALRQSILLHANQGTA